MANEGVTESQSSTVEKVQRAILTAEDPQTGELKPIQGDQGVLRVNLVTGGGERLTDALDSVGDDELRIAPPGKLDVDLAAQSVASVTVTDDGNLAIASLPEPLDVSDAEVDVDLNTQTVSPITVTDDGNLAIASYNGGTLPTEQQTPVAIENSDGTNIDPLAAQNVSVLEDSTATAGNNVTFQLGGLRKDVDLFVDVSGPAMLTVEVRQSGGSWRQFDAISYSSATTEVEQYSTAFAELRARVDQNLNALEGSAKGA